ncbi:unannotated protein [freshwater metagenome]|uniref:Unannotated protein n=1 Tax=freshwater metagenome TaxID=449393 RepID=A0A6J5ZB39_9ZZZZ
MLNIYYFFLYPVGHLGLTAVTFLISLPFTHLIVVFGAGTLGLGVGLATDSSNDTFILGTE